MLLFYSLLDGCNGSSARSPTELFKITANRAIVALELVTD
jgi:hypothetical protein